MVTVEVNGVAGTLGEIQGVTSENRDTLASLKQSLDDLITLVTGISNNTESFVKDMGDKAENIVVGGGQGDKTEGKADAKADGGKAQAKLDVKLSDVANIPANFIMGSLLINSTLLNIQKTLNDILKSMASKGGAPTAVGKKAKVDASTHTGPEFHIDAKQMSGMAKGLLEIGKAAIILKLIPTKIITHAAQVVTVFIDSMVACANRMGKNAKHLESFSKGVLNMIKAVKDLSTASILIAACAPFIALANIVVNKFISPMIESLAKVFKKVANKAFLKALDGFTSGAVKIAFAMLLFGVTLLILVQVGKNVLNALKGLLAMIGLIGVVALLGIVSIYAMPAIAGFSGFAIGLGVAMILFAVAVLLMSKIKVDQKAINSVTNAVIGVANSFATLVPIIMLGVIGVTLFAVFSALLFVGMLSFTLSAVLMVASSKLLEKIGIDKETGTPRFLLTAGKIAEQFALMAIPLIFGIIGAALFFVFSAVLLVGMAVFTVDALLMFVVDILMSHLTLSKDGTPQFLDTIGAIAVKLINLAPLFGIASLAMIPGLVFAAELAVFSIALAISTAAMLLVQKAAEKLETPAKLSKMGESIKQAGVGMMLSFLGVDPAKGIGVASMLEAGKNAIGLTALGVLACATVLPMALFMSSLALIGTSFVKLSDSMKHVDSASIYQIMSALSMIMDSLGSFASNMKGTSAKTITAIGGLVKDVAEAIGLLTDIVIKLKDGIPDDQIQAATHTMLSICEKLFGTPGRKKVEGQYTLTDTLETIARADLSDLNAEAVGAIKPLMEGIGAMAEVVRTIGDTETFSDEVMRAGVQNMNKFLELMVNTCDAMQYLITKKPTGETQKRGGLLGVFGIEKEVKKSPLEAMNEVIDSGLFDSMRTVFNSLSDIGDQVAKFDAKKFEGITNFLASNAIIIMTNQSSLFITGMSNFAKGIGYLKSNDLNNFKKFLDLLGGVNATTLKNTVDSLSTLGKYSSQFKATADSFDRMEKALSKMANKRSQISSLFGAIKEAASNVNKGDLEKATDAAVGGTGLNPVQGIYDVIRDWNTNGIPIRARLNTDTGEILPRDVGNSTGKGVSR